MPILLPHFSVPHSGGHCGGMQSSEVSSHNGSWGGGGGENALGQGFYTLTYVVPSRLYVSINPEKLLHFLMHFLAANVFWKSSPSLTTSLCWNQQEQCCQGLRTFATETQQHNLPLHTSCPNKYLAQLSLCSWIKVYVSVTDS